MLTDLRIGMSFFSLLLAHFPDGHRDRSGLLIDDRMNLIQSTLLLASKPTRALFFRSRGVAVDGEVVDVQIPGE